MKTEKFVTVVFPADYDANEWYSLYTCPNTPGSQAIIITLGATGFTNGGIKVRSNGVDKYEQELINFSSSGIRDIYKYFSLDAGDELLFKAGFRVWITLLEIENVT